MLKFTGLEYVKIAIANAYGLDKGTWQERLDWVANQPSLVKLVEEAKEPYQYLAGIQALNNAMIGKPTGYVMGLDACSSGIQLMALLSGDVIAAEHCGLIHTGSRKDIHQSILTDMNEPSFIRGDIKDCAMKVMYGSQAEPKKVLGDDVIISKFYAQLKVKLPECIKLLKVMLDSHSSKATEYTWTMPDGHVVCVPVMDNKSYTISIGELDNTPFAHRIKENRAVDYDVSLAANIIQSVDAYVVRELGLRCNHNAHWLNRALKLTNGLNVRKEKYAGCVSIVRAYELSTQTLLSYSNAELYAIQELCKNVLSNPQFEQISVHKNYCVHA